MNKFKWILIVIAVVLTAGGAVYFSNTKLQTGRVGPFPENLDEAEEDADAVGQAAETGGQQVADTAQNVVEGVADALTGLAVARPVLDDRDGIESPVRFVYHLLHTSNNSGNTNIEIGATGVAGEFTLINYLLTESIKIKEIKLARGFENLSDELASNQVQVSLLRKNNDGSYSSISTGSIEGDSSSQKIVFRGNPLIELPQAQLSNPAMGLRVFRIQFSSSQDSLVSKKFSILPPGKDENFITAETGSGISIKPLTNELYSNQSLIWTRFITSQPNKMYIRTNCTSCSTQSYGTQQKHFEFANFTLSAPGALQVHRVVAQLNGTNKLGQSGKIKNISLVRGSKSITGELVNNNAQVMFTFSEDSSLNPPININGANFGIEADVESGAALGDTYLEITKIYQKLPPGTILTEINVNPTLPMRMNKLSVIPFSSSGPNTQNMAPVSGDQPGQQTTTGVPGATTNQRQPAFTRLLKKK